MVSMPSVSHTPAINFDKKIVPRSDKTRRGIPYLLIISRKHWAASVAEADLIGMASGHLLAKHTYVNKYLAPLLPLGKGPTRSTHTLSNGTQTICLSIIFDFLFPALFTRKHTSQDLTYETISLWTLGQVKRRPIKLLIPLTPLWEDLSWARVKILSR